MGLSRTHSYGVRAMIIRDTDYNGIIIEIRSDGSYEKDLHRQAKLALVHDLVYDSRELCETDNL